MGLENQHFNLQQVNCVCSSSPLSHSEKWVSMLAPRSSLLCCCVGVLTVDWQIRSAMQNRHEWWISCWQGFGTIDLPPTSRLIYRWFGIQFCHFTAHSVSAGRKKRWRRGKNSGWWSNRKPRRIPPQTLFLTVSQVRDSIITLWLES